MATATAPAPAPSHLKIGRDDGGRRVSFEEFILADFEGQPALYELSRGVVVVTDVPRPEHGEIVEQVAWMFFRFRDAHPGIIRYQAGGNECRLRLPGMESDRHPDQAIYLTPRPEVDQPWTLWVPQVVVEIISPGGEARDLIEKREEYLLMGALEYWIIDPESRRMLALRRAGDTWDELMVAAGQTYRTHLLPGLDVRPADLFGEV